MQIFCRCTFVAWFPGSLVAGNNYQNLRMAFHYSGDGTEQSLLPLAGVEAPKHPDDFFIVRQSKKRPGFRLVEMRRDKPVKVCAQRNNFYFRAGHPS